MASTAQGYLSTIRSMLPLPVMPDIEEAALFIAGITWHTSACNVEEDQ